MYERYDPCYVHREAVGWHKQYPPDETISVMSALLVDPGHSFTIPIHQRWHKDLTDDKGYESEPDEGRRTRTQYRRHYARRKIDRFECTAVRVRAPSYESLRLAFVLSRR
jgi:hypothetical protein